MKFNRIPLVLLTPVLIAVALSTALGDSLEDGFHNPPRSARPQTWWHWMNGNITKEGITLDLEAMKRIGLGGAEIFNVDSGIPHGPVQFMSPEWRELFKFAVQEANRLGLELCVHNCAGWSSSGGPWITPAQAMQKIVTTEVSVNGPTNYSQTLPQPETNLGFYRDIAVLAYPQPSGTQASVENLQAKAGYNGRPVSAAESDTSTNGAVPRSALVDLTSKMDAEGHLDWEVPAGAWTILRIGYTPTGQKNHPAPPEGTGLECDKLSRAGLDEHWAGFMQKILDDVGPLAGKTLDDALIDSYEVGGQNWTPKFREDFRQLRGYDLLPFLPAFAGQVVDNPEVTDRFLWDVRRTIADLFAENYYGYFATLCHEHGLKASIEPYTGPFESLQSGAPADIVMGEFWSGSQGNPSVKIASSVAHIYGKTIVGAESFTATPSRGRWQNTPYSLKALGDLMYCHGLNRYIFHRYAMQPWTNRWPGMTMGQWGFHFERTSTWWEQGKPWIDYVTRCQFLLQQGRPVADVAYFCGENAPVDLRAGNPALPEGYDWDAINADVLLHRTSVRDGRLTLPDGVSYAALVLPPEDRNMTPQLLERLREYVEQGATIVGPPPQHSPSLEGFPQCDTQVKELAAALWGECDGKSVTENVVGQGRVFWGQSLAKVFASRGLKPDFEFTGDAPETRLAYVHRVAGNADIYFVSNQRSLFDAADCTFRVFGKTPELWNPDTDTIEPAPIWHEQDGRTTVHLTFDPAGSVFVVLRSKAEGDHLVAVQRTGLPSTEPPPKKAELRILKAEYGAFPDGNKSWTDVTANVKSLVAHGAHQIPANNDMAGDDPASGIVKRLRVQFQLHGQSQTLEATEGSSLTLPEGSTVVKAIYGNIPSTTGQSWQDVTARVKSLVAQGTRQVPASNELAGEDPAPNIAKQLSVEYRLNDQTHTNVVNEGETLNLPAGAEVGKAIYGQLHPPAVARNQGTMDVTSKLATLVKQEELSVQVGNDLAGGDPAWLTPKELRVEYSLDGVVKHTTVPEGEMLILPEAGLSVGTPPTFGLVVGGDKATQLQVMKPGTFTFTWISGRQTKAQCASVPAPLAIAGPWEVRFPPGWKAPAQVTLNHLQSWTESSNSGVKYFSGTATYVKDIAMPADLPGSSRELWLDLGQVKNFADVTLNGQHLGLLWKPPFRVNISSVVKPGTNHLEIKVTNLWPNRLIGDEQLPADCEWLGKRLASWPEWLLEGKPSPTGRLTFTTWHHWTKDSRLLESGLLGPVTVQTVVLEPVD